MSKKAIIIIGNMASGKTTVARLISRRLPGYKTICLDDFREGNSVMAHLSPKKREELSKHECLGALRANEHILFEATGVSSFYRGALALLDKLGADVFILKILCPVEVCLRRYADRVGSPLKRPPVRGYRAMTPKETIHLIHAGLKTAGHTIALDSTRHTPEEIVEVFFHEYR